MNIQGDVINQTLKKGEIRNILEEVPGIREVPEIEGITIESKQIDDTTALIIYEILKKFIREFISNNKSAFASDGTVHLHRHMTRMISDVAQHDFHECQPETKRFIQQNARYFNALLLHFLLEKF